jgi:hypothetical protein
MTKGRWIFTGVATVAALALTATLAFGAGRSGSTPWNTGYYRGQSMFAAADRMHDSPAMQSMMAGLPADLRAQCDAMHDQMSQMMSGAGMGVGMMSGTAMMGGDHASHHPNGAATIGGSSGSGMMGW